MPLCRQTESARGGEIERFGITDHFTDDTGQIAAPHAFFQREQHILRPFRDYMDDPVPQISGQSGAIGSPGQANRGAVLHPQYGAPVGSFRQRARLGRRQHIHRQCQCRR